MNDHLHFPLERCFAAIHCWVNVSEQPGIALSPDAPGHDYDKLHRKRNFQLPLNMLNSILIQIGDGKNTPFSEAKWLHEQPLKI
jgi:hypothetical protein